MLQKAVPVYLNVLNVNQDSDEFFIYTNILDQVLVFQRYITDVTPRTIDMVKVLSGVKSEAGGFSRTASQKRMDKDGLQPQTKAFEMEEPGATEGAKGQPLDLSTLRQMSNADKAKIFQKARELGAPIDALQDFDAEADISPAELDPVAAVDGDEAGEDMVNNLLDESSDVWKSGEERDNDGRQSKAKERINE
jgi:hypothetical protein